MPATEPVAIYHNPRCSKSRATLEILRGRGIDPSVIRYLETPPDRSELERVLGLLGVEPRQIMRTGEKEYRDLGLDDPALTREQLITAILAHPILLERPIVVANGKAAIGRPPERVLEIL
jgi:arsenate reductase (glutaredoxin)